MCFLVMMATTVTTVVNGESVIEGNGYQSGYNRLNQNDDVVLFSYF